MNPKLNVILVRTKYPSNIGQTARAMANTNADRLILIEPKCELGSDARRGAAGAQEQLKNHVIYPSWDAFYAEEGDGIRIALSRRSGKKRKASLLPEALIQISNRIAKGVRPNIYFVFGPEDNGLNSEDLAFCNICCGLPTWGDFASLNLSQAALLCLYIARTHFGDKQSSDIITDQARDELKEQTLQFPDQTIKDWLTAIGFDINARRASAYITVRRLLLENLPTATELMVLDSILQQNIRKLNKQRD